MIYRCCYGPSFCQAWDAVNRKTRTVKASALTQTINIFIHIYIYIIYILYIFWYICRQIIDKRFRSHSPKKVGCLSSSTPFSRLAGGSRQDRFVVSTASHPCCTLAARCIGCMLFSFTASLPKEFQSLCMKDSSGQIPTQKNTAWQGNSQYISALQASNLDAKAREEQAQWNAKSHNIFSTSLAARWTRYAHF